MTIPISVSTFESTEFCNVFFYFGRWFIIKASPGCWYCRYHYVDCYCFCFFVILFCEGFFFKRMRKYFVDEGVRLSVLDIAILISPIVPFWSVRHDIAIIISLIVISFWSVLHDICHLIISDCFILVCPS